MTNQERITSHNALIDQAIAKANALPDAGSGGASVECEIITIPAGATSATYTLPRVTNACGTVKFDISIRSNDDYNLVMGVRNDVYTYIHEFDGSDIMGGNIETSTAHIYYNRGTITWDAGAFIGEDVLLILVNDPNAPVLWTCTPS